MHTYLLTEGIWPRRTGLGKKKKNKLYSHVSQRAAQGSETRPPPAPHAAAGAGRRARPPSPPNIINAAAAGGSAPACACPVPPAAGSWRARGGAARPTSPARPAAARARRLLGPQCLGLGGPAGAVAPAGRLLPCPGEARRAARPPSLTRLVRISCRRGEALASTTLLLTSFPSTGFNAMAAAQLLSPPLRADRGRLMAAAALYGVGPAGRSEGQAAPESRQEKAGK